MTSMHPPRRELRSAHAHTAASAFPATHAATGRHAMPVHNAAHPQMQTAQHAAPAHSQATSTATTSVPSSSSSSHGAPPLRRSSSASSVSSSHRHVLQSGPVRHRLPGAAGVPRVPAPGAPPLTAAEEAASTFTVPEIIADPSVKRINSAGVEVCKQYRRGRYLGKGGFAVCYELTSLESGRTYAGKIIPRATLVNKPSAQKKMVHEIKIHRSINHQGVVKFERFFEDNQNVYLLLELCPNHSLMELVRRRQRLTETETQFYMWQLVNTMSFLHGQNIIHRDLKLGNLFLTENLDIRIGDFGLATQLEHADQRKQTLCGTPNYIAPEILGKTGHSFEVDTWAMGVIMYTLLYGRPPFETNSVDSTYERIKGGVYTFPPGVPVSHAAQAMIQRILHSQASRRPTLQALKSDPFFSQSPFPDRLPLSCLTTPLDWKHACHADLQGAGATVAATTTAQENTLVQQKAQQSGLASGGNAVVPRSALSNRAGANNLPQGPAAGTNAADVQKPHSQPQLGSSRQVPTLTRASSAAAIVQSTQPLSARSAAVAPLPPNAEVKAAAPASSGSIAIAVPKRSSATAAPGTGAPVAERRVTRRTSGEEARSAQPSPPTAAAVDELDAVVAAMATAAIDGKNGVAAPHVVISGTSADANEAPEDEEEVGALRKMHDEIERSFCGGSATDAPAAAAVPSRPCTAAPLPAPVLVPASIWVNKWVDYSNKYGLGYLLSNGSAGVYFNDSSKAILSADGENFEYIERRHAPGSAAAQAMLAAGTAERACYTLSSYPPALQKKVTLLRHFTSHLIKPSSPSSTSDNPTTAPAATDEPQVSRRSPPKPPSSSAAGTPASPPPAAVCASSLDASGGLIYVKKWLRTKHAIFFRLSNRTVQVLFQDHTELVLSSLTNCVTYTDKTRKRSTIFMERLGGSSSTSPKSRIADPEADRPDLAKRMKYTKEILHLLLNKGSGAAAAATAANANAAAQDRR